MSSAFLPRRTKGALLIVFGKTHSPSPPPADTMRKGCHRGGEAMGGGLRSRMRLYLIVTRRIALHLIVPGSAQMAHLACVACAESHGIRLGPARSLLEICRSLARSLLEVVLGVFVEFSAEFSAESCAESCSEFCVESRAESCSESCMESCAESCAEFCVEFCAESCPESCVESCAEFFTDSCVES